MAQESVSNLAPMDVREQKESGPRSTAGRFVFSTHSELRVLVDAAVELRIDALCVRHRECHIAPKHAAFVVLAYRENLVLRPTVLANEAPEIAETLTATKLPERLFAEEQTRRGVLRCQKRRTTCPFRS